ncbi:MAG: WbuC family cupin fold metalloprotein [Bacteroidetes bacterium]|nr:WbuC family cupin fold metalloprotein [Bacteroidota bacterium]
MIKINHQLLEALTERAMQSDRKRMNYNFHSGPPDPMQRMLNAIEPGSYIRPHKHEKPDKREVFFVLRGRILILEFDDHGHITDHILLDPSAGNYAAEVPERTWHSMIALEPGSVAYEVKDGPWDPADDKVFASWAPPEESEEVKPYMDKILEKLKLI